MANSVLLRCTILHNACLFAPYDFKQFASRVRKINFMCLSVRLASNVRRCLESYSQGVSANLNVDWQRGIKIMWLEMGNARCPPDTKHPPAPEEWNCCNCKQHCDSNRCNCRKHVDLGVPQLAVSAGVKGMKVPGTVVLRSLYITYKYK